MAGWGPWGPFDFFGSSPDRDGLSVGHPAAAVAGAELRKGTYAEEVLALCRWHPLPRFAGNGSKVFPWQSLGSTLVSENITVFSSLFGKACYGKEVHGAKRASSGCLLIGVLQ